FTVNRRTGTGGGRFTPSKVPVAMVPTFHFLTALSCKSSLPDNPKAVNSLLVRYSASARAAAALRIASRWRGGNLRSSAAVQRLPAVAHFLVLIALFL